MLQREDPIDLFGNSINPRDIVTDDLLGAINNLNPTLGTAADPHYEEYLQFKQELQNADVITLDINTLSKNSMESINFDINSRTRDITDCDSWFVKVGKTLETLFKGVGFGIESMDSSNGIEGFEDYADFDEENSFGIDDLYGEDIVYK